MLGTSMAGASDEPGGGDEILVVLTLAAFSGVVSGLSIFDNTLLGAQAKRRLESRRKHSRHDAHS